MCQKILEEPDLFILKWPSFARITIQTLENFKETPEMEKNISKVH